MPGHKAAQYLISKSPIDIVNMQDIGNINMLGYYQKGDSNKFFDSPVIFCSSD